MHSELGGLELNVPFKVTKVMLHNHEGQDMHSELGGLDLNVLFKVAKVNVSTLCLLQYLGKYQTLHPDSLMQGFD